MLKMSEYMLREKDIQKGTRLICIESDRHDVTVGETYTIIVCHTELLFPYRISTDADYDRGIMASLDVLNGTETLFSQLKYILESDLTGKELFTLKMSGKLPRRLL